MESEMSQFKPLLGRVKPANRRICMLMVTHACNLNCAYCYETHKSNKKMSFDVARRALLGEVELVKSSTKYKELEVDFMGGEPLLNFALIREIVEWLEGENLGIPFVTFCSTNGTLITDEMKSWFRDHRKYCVLGLSYDGDAFMQEVNRSSTPVDIGFFVEIWGRPEIHITVSHETLPRLASGILSLQRLGGEVSVALAQGIEWTSDDARIFSHELRKLADVYLSDDTLSPIHLLSQALYTIGLRSEEPMRFCGAGQGMVTYDVDGICYPCHMFSPIVAGTHAVPLSSIDMCSQLAISDPYCAECIFKNWCPTCYGYNYWLCGKTGLRNHSWCEMIYAEAMVCCEFQLKYYDQHRDKISDADRLRIRALLDAYKALNNEHNWRKRK